MARGGSRPRGRSRREPDVTGTEAARNYLLGAVVGVGIIAASLVLNNLAAIAAYLAGVI